MCIDVTNAFAHQSVVFDEVKHLIVRGHVARWNRGKKVEYLAPAAQRAAGKLADHEGVDENFRVVERLDKLRN